MVTVHVDEAQKRLYRERGWWRDRTLIEDFRQAAATHPDKVAIVGYRAESGERDVLSFRHLSRLVDRFAGALLELGVRPGEPVSYQLPNWWQFTALTLACLRIGAVTNPLVPILRRREVEFILRHVESRVCVVPGVFRGFAYGEMLASLAPSVPTLEHVFVIGQHRPPGTRDFNEHFLGTRWEDRHSPQELDALRRDPDEVVQIQYTSGTTGEPKGVMHTQNTLYAAVWAMREMLHLGAEDVVLMASTMAHQTGYLYGLLMPLMTGMKVVYQDIWQPARMLELVEEEGVTYTMGATPFVADAVAAQRESPRDLSTFRYFACGGAPIPPPLARDAHQVLACRLVSLWGMTENGAVTYVRPEDPPERASQSDGVAAPSMEVRVVDDEGREVLRRSVGRLVVRGAAQCVGYFKRPDLYRSALDDDGWFDTGDLAWMDEEGYIRIAGRTKDLLIRGGENIPVLEVEGALYQHPRVREVAVVGYPDERLGERACAVVVPEGPPPTLEDLKAHLEALGMAKHFWPERLEIVEEMPKTASGKIQKFRLREMLARPSP